MNDQRFQFLARLLAAGALVLTLAGCGGGSGSAIGKQPTRATKDRVQQIQTHNFRLLAQNGGQLFSTASARNGVSLNSGVAASGAAGSAELASPPAAPLPMVGAFIQNVAAVPRTRRASLQRSHSTRDIDPNFYFDEYLGLWVQIADSPTLSTYTLFEDEAKTKPAGSIVTVIPAQDANPQTYSSTYSFEAGLLKGSHGSYKTTQNSDGSGKMSYDDTYSDGWSDSGNSQWTAHGDYTWSSHTNMAGSLSTNDRGTFHADGSGNTHSDASDGYLSDFTYRADGSGIGHVSGPLPGLPATIVWDSFGNTTITYADGSVDRFDGWAGPSGGGGSSGNDGITFPTDVGGGTGAATTSNTGK